MALTTLSEIAALAGPGRRLMGLDVGKKTIGLALSDVSRAIASAAETIRRGRFKDDAQAIARLCVAEDVGGLIVGLPVSMNGSEGPMCQSVRQFADNLLGHLDLPLAFWDERLSTAAIERLLVDEADMTRKRRAEIVDKMAAAYILQGALDAIASRTTRVAGGASE